MTFCLVCGQEHDTPIDREPGPSCVWYNPRNGKPCSREEREAIDAETRERMQASIAEEKARNLVRRRREARAVAVRARAIERAEEESP